MFSYNVFARNRVYKSYNIIYTDIMETKDDKKCN